MTALAAIPFTAGNLEQGLANGIIAGTAYALVAVGFGMIITVTGRFHIAYGSIYALTAFVAGQVGISWGLPFAAALVLGVLAAVLVAAAIELFIYWPLNRRLGAAALMTIFIVSLGLSTAGQNAISLAWLNSGTVNITTFNVQGAHFAQVFTTNLAITGFIVGWVAILAVAAVVKWTKLGRMIRAVQVNQRLSLAVGINPKAVYLAVFVFGTALGGIGAVFTAAQSTATADMGSTPILYAITVAFIAGSSSPLVIAMVAIIVGLIQSLCTFVVQPEWAQVVVFSGLLVYVLGKVVQANMGNRRRKPPAMAAGAEASQPVSSPTTLADRP